MEKSMKQTRSIGLVEHREERFVEQDGNLQICDCIQVRQIETARNECD